MSFKTNHSKYSHHKRYRRLSRRPEWDSSINDQTLFKATPDEIKRRQEAHRSKNLELVRQALLEKKIAKARREAMGNISKAPKGNAFLREILFNEQDTYSLMEDTNRALQVAQDVFAEETRKYRGFPKVTQVDSDDENNAVISRPAPVDGLIKRDREETTLLDKLSESVTKKTALNETYSASDSENSEHETTASPSAHPESLVDLKRFQNLVENEVSSIAATHDSNSDQTNLLKSVESLTAVKDRAAPKTSAVTKSKTRSSRNTVSATPDLHKLLSELESTINKVGEELGLTRDHKQTGVDSSSYTVSLIQTLLYMTQFFPQLLKRQDDERRERKLLERNLIDATNRADMLASELFQTQDQFNLMLDEFKNLKVHQQQEIQLLKENVERMSQGRAVHIVNVDQPTTSPVNKTSPSRKKASPNKVLRELKENRSPITLHPSKSPTVKEHVAYKESPEQLRLQSVAHCLEAQGASKENEDDEMSIERKIEQLRSDHQLTLERFRKLGEELENTKPTVGWD